jgi:hypothetical protein
VVGFVLSQVRRKNKYAPNLGHPMITGELDTRNLDTRNLDARNLDARNLGHPVRFHFRLFEEAFLRDAARARGL